MTKSKILPIEEIRKINPAYANAISRDVADRGNALAEKIAAADESIEALDEFVCDLPGVAVEYDRHALGLRHHGIRAAEARRPR